MRKTAFLISPCHVLTNHHYTYELPDYNNPEINRKISSTTFSVGQAKAGKGPFESRVNATPIGSGKFRTLDPGHPDYNKVRKQDFAVLRLDECIGDKHGWLKLEKMDPSFAGGLGPLQISGYPRQS